MNERTSHRHYCEGCEYTWNCGRTDCGRHDLCDDCERAHFEAYMERRGLTVSQPEIPELALAPKDK